MKNRTAAAIFAVIAVYFALFAVYTYDRSAQIPAMVKDWEPSFIGVYLLAFLSAVSAVFSVASLRNK